MASRNSTKNTDFEGRKSATLGNEELDEVKAKVDSVHKLLKKYFSFAEDMKAIEINSDGDLEEDVNFISGTGFLNQKPGNQSVYKNSYENGQRSNFNQSSQFEKSYRNNFNNNNNINYGNSSYQNVPPQTRESKIEAIIEQVLKGHQKLMVNINGNIDIVYTELNAKFEALNTHVKKLETHVVHIREAVKKQDTFIKSKGDEALKYHMNAIIEDDLWQVVKEEKLQEGDVEVESSMSFGSSHWCPSTTPGKVHRSMESDEHRSISVVHHRSTKSVPSCETVKIMTHEKFTAKHLYPLKPFIANIDWQNEQVTD